jgi:hypothetical protein
MPLLEIPRFELGEYSYLDPFKTRVRVFDGYVDGKARPIRRSPEFIFVNAFHRPYFIEPDYIPGEPSMVVLDDWHRVLVLPSEADIFYYYMSHNYSTWRDIKRVGGRLGIVNSQPHTIGEITFLQTPEGFQGGRFIVLCELTELGEEELVDEAGVAMAPFTTHHRWRKDRLEVLDGIYDFFRFYPAFLLPESSAKI